MKNNIFTHNESTARLADRIVRIEDGKLSTNVPVPSVSYEENVLSGGGPEGYMDIEIMLPSAYDIEGQMDAITGWATPGKNAATAVNWAYMTSSVDPVSALLAVAVLFVILLSGYLVIYNIFYINVTSDIRYYGLLKTVGATGAPAETYGTRSGAALIRCGNTLRTAGGLVCGRSCGHI